MNNNQPVEKSVAHLNRDTLAVHSVFETIQGEGPFSGTPAIFVRLAGCNLQCPSCDTDYTSRRWMATSKDILRCLEETAPYRLVVITGGEPFRQNLTGLLHVLVEAGYYVQVETNGTLEPSKFQYTKEIIPRKGVYIVCSPKTGKIHPRIEEEACCFKYVLSSDSIHDDFLPLHALGHPAVPFVARPVLPSNLQPIYIQPEDSKDPELNQLNLKAAIRTCLVTGHILQLQIHKLIDME